MAFVPPISRDGFYYNGDLYVEVGDFNRHKRAPVSEIKSILRPDLKAAKNTLPSDKKDPVGHWYEAQLIHYGLPASKTKAVSKSRLLDALNEGKLVVPPAILRLEEGLRKEYAGLERKAKAVYKANMAGGGATGGEAEDGKAGKKRKQNDVVGTNVTSSTTVGMGGASDGPPPTKKVRATPAKASEKKAVGGSHQLGRAMPVRRNRQRRKVQVWNQRGRRLRARLPKARTSLSPSKQL